MSDRPQTYPLDEFASYELKEDKNKAQFVITISGDAKYKHMISDKIGELAFSDEDLKKWGVG
jgi:hypothetical protein